MKLYPVFRCGRNGYDAEVSYMSIMPRVGDYSTWTEDELRREVDRRGLTHGVGFSSPETAQRVKDQLIEILTGDDNLSSELKKIAARYVGAHCDKETKP